MVMTMNEIKERVKPVAEKHNVPVVYVFGSYARNEAKETSDIDFAVDITAQSEEAYWNLYGDFFEELKEAVAHDIDLVELETLVDTQDKPERRELLATILKEGVKVFER
ncbi:nucleotidyltransferase family protein [Enterococcus faecalis]|uniref:nucleotidyltransferase family protein n=1 Tax=Enterococcus faecalis TaxID=1351 RepID=UPI002DB6B4B1|nr:nucleotidyltransferase domain-containing protein [Enterococcus faecalis]MEB6403501.1 nucleotidyltransferase domain-containing protein [Enterococcus faecalis]MEB7975132.1 nucleotidyltransferase domain-containing protein [Enterococcus faecalis]